jgi:hypothetical protein
VRRVDQHAVNIEDCATVSHEYSQSFTVSSFTIAAKSSNQEEVCKQWARALLCTPGFYAEHRADEQRHPLHCARQRLQELGNCIGSRTSLREYP